MVSFPSCYYIRIVGVVRVRTILLFLIWKANYYSRSWPATTQYCPRQCSLQKSRGWLHDGHCKYFFSSFYWTKSRILCRKVKVIVSTDDRTSCSPLLTARLATHVLFYELLKFVRARVKKVEREHQKNIPPIFDTIIVLWDKYYIRKVQSLQIFRAGLRCDGSDKSGC